ncbi:MAG TPA: hypothetical protein DCP53_04995 [Elusimicrobia bacterium]|nr:MAG: hypothetical protein A2551_05615 [Elusimicrobia bacterium RIFOXYD2_FULL_34_30]HAM38738.1 hypothetical protein [Elusimicrobiota bacterium]
MKKQNKKLKNKNIIIQKENMWQDFIYAKNDFIIASAIVFSLLLVYLLLPCKQFFFDGLMYASIVEAKESGWQTRLGWANHLSFNYYGHAFWWLLKQVGINKDGYSALQIMNSIFGAFTVGIFFLFLRKLISKIWITVVFSYLLAFSYAYWYRAIDAQVYPPSIFWLLISFILTWSYMRQKSRLKLIILSVTTALSVLAHQGNVFFMPMVITGICISNKNRIKDSVTFILISGIIIAIPYLHVLAYQEKTLVDRNTGEIAINKTTIKNSFTWLRGNAGDYTPDDDKYVNDYWNLKLKHLITDFKTIIGAVWFNKGNYYSYGYPSDSGLIWTSISKILFIFIAIFLFFKEKIYQKYKSLFLLAVSWWLSYMLFVSWFNPGNPDYWYQHLMPIYCLIACSLYEFLKDEQVNLLLKKSVIGVLLCSIIIIPLINFFDSIYPISRVENNVIYSRTLFIKKHVKTGGVVIISGMGHSNPQKVYIPSFANVGRISFDLIFIYNPKEKGLQYLKYQLEMLMNQGINTYVLSEIFSDYVADGLKTWNVKMSEIKEIFNPYEFKVLGTYYDGMKIMQMYPKKGSIVYQRKIAMDKYNAKRYDECLNNYLNIPEQNMTAYDYKIMGNCYIFLNDKKNALKVWGKASIMDPQDNNLKEVLQKYGQ